jgi:hypothetical protein
MTIHTTVSLQTKRHRLEAHLEAAQHVLTAMRRGAALHLRFTQRGPQWQLSSGRRVSDEVAKMVTASASVVGVGDALFEGAPSQTWRWWADGA